MNSYTRSDYRATADWVARLWKHPEELQDLIDWWLADIESAVDDLGDDHLQELPPGFCGMTDLLILLLDSKTTIDPTPLDKLHRGLMAAMHPSVWHFGKPIDAAAASDLLRESMRTLERLQAAKPSMADLDDDPVEHVLRGQALAIYRRLGQTTQFVHYRSLAELDCWRQPPPEDQTVHRGLRTLQSELNKLAVAPNLEIDAEHHRARLVR